MKINGIKVADWAAREYRKEARATWLAEFFIQVRLIFVFLFIATVLTFVFNRQTMIKYYASSRFAQLQRPSGLIFNGAVKHQREVDDINQKIHETP